MHSISKLTKTKTKFMEALEIPTICRQKLMILLISGRLAQQLIILWFRIKMMILSNLESF
jgi:hypothetical protein